MHFVNCMTFSTDDPFNAQSRCIYKRNKYCTVGLAVKRFNLARVRAGLTLVIGYSQSDPISFPDQTAHSLQWHCEYIKYTLCCELLVNTSSICYKSHLDFFFASSLAHLSSILNSIRLYRMTVFLLTPLNLNLDPSSSSRGTLF